ncbi:polysaccharide pyruvyl transferase family protein [Stieleria sp. TO1_6]|uniref:polysaccharide pyruvyl transferase family protein n=1 Tax=Stieleria tagensis TaxID=2956795 RepID=UPI00209B5CBA|nr:polysaccharide pyruvyl transferase family protein [Stieleria tagensis]MCO8120680.1 polysaccharide pyruvyl transferase family protein [Stieleria tagensis]
MTKIGVVTYHYGYNEGTLLQAYSTQQLLARHCPSATVQLVDWRCASKEPRVFPAATDDRQRAMRAFFDEKLVLSEQTLYDSDPDLVFRKLKGQFDLLVLGSDELWRLDYCRGRKWRIPRLVQTNVMAPPFPNVYWADARKVGCPCVSLASSISERNQLQLVPRRHRSQMRHALKNLSVLSVRDSRSQDFVRQIVGDSTKIQWLPDPTFALQFDRKRKAADLRAEIARHAPNSERPIALVISHSESDALAQTVRMCRDRGMQTVGLTHAQADLDVDLSKQFIDPLTWAAAPAIADVVITDRFHGALFSLQAGTPIIALDYRPQRNGSESKLADLCRRFDVMDRCHQIAHFNSETEAVIQRQLTGDDWDRTRIDEVVREFGTRLDEFVRTQILTLLPVAQCNA